MKNLLFSGPQISIMGYRLNKIILVLAALICLHKATAQQTTFIKVPAGTYEVGMQNDERNPLRKAKVNAFYIAAYETTNQQFAAFVAATGYVTDAEKRHNALVFEPPLDEFRWKNDSTAYWRYPNGVTRGGITNRMNHPVTCISYRDVQAYCAWAHVRLPTLDEWEIACRAGTRTAYFFGNSHLQIKPYANIWYGHDHKEADYTDGYMTTSPVGHFKPNPWGLYDVYGNVFEFCSGKLFPTQNPSLAHARGGSWWCSSASCHAFNSYMIGQVNNRASFSNQGFRVVKINGQ